MSWIDEASVLGVDGIYVYMLVGVRLENAEPSSPEPEDKRDVNAGFHPVRARPCILALRVIRVVGIVVVIVSSSHATQKVPSLAIRGAAVAYHSAGSVQW